MEVGELVSYILWMVTIHPTHHRSEIRVSDDSPVNTNKQKQWFHSGANGFPSFAVRGLQNYAVLLCSFLLKKKKGGGGGGEKHEKRKNKKHSQAAMCPLSAHIQNSDPKHQAPASPSPVARPHRTAHPMCWEPL